MDTKSEVSNLQLLDMKVPHDVAQMWVAGHANWVKGP